MKLEPIYVSLLFNPSLHMHLLSFICNCIALAHLAVTTPLTEWIAIKALLLTPLAVWLITKATFIHNINGYHIKKLNSCSTCLLANTSSLYMSSYYYPREHTHTHALALLCVRQKQFQETRNAPGCCQHYKKHKFNLCSTRFLDDVTLICIASKYCTLILSGHTIHWAIV